MSKLNPPIISKYTEHLEKCQKRCQEKSKFYAEKAEFYGKKIEEEKSKQV